MPVEITCIQCGAHRSVKPRDATRKFCSKDCQRAHEATNGRAATKREPIKFPCQHCGEEFAMMPGYVTQYRKMWGRDPLYCSGKCTGAARRAKTEAAAVFTCKECGKETTRARYNTADGAVRYYNQQKYCSVECKADGQKKIALARFEAGDYGRHLKRHGYVAISIPSLVTGKKHHVLEHRFVMAKHIGRELTDDETVHHINGDRGDNRIENLELFSSRHGPGQGVADKIAFAIEMITTYPEFARNQGYVLTKIDGGG